MFIISTTSALVSGYNYICVMITRIWGEREGKCMSVSQSNEHVLKSWLPSGQRFWQLAFWSCPANGKRTDPSEIKSAQAPLIFFLKHFNIITVGLL